VNFGFFGDLDPSALLRACESRNYRRDRLASDFGFSDTDLVAAKGRDVLPVAKSGVFCG